MATVRRVRRIIRKIDPWTALKVSSVVWAVLGLALVLGGIIFWSVLDRAGVPQRMTDFMVEITLIDEGAQPFANVEQFFRVMIFGTVVWWVTMTGATVAGAIVYNLVSDVVGGLELVVLEETLNPVAAPQQVLHPPNDFAPGNGSITPPPDHADIPTQESPRIRTSQRP
jgi:hypothetical protein